jgi:hypothetical protein
VDRLPPDLYDLLPEIDVMNDEIAAERAEDEARRQRGALGADRG